jgi:protein ImuB
MFRPPLRAMVDASRGYPQQVSAWGPNRSVYGKVVRLAGPWRKTGDWWRDDGWARDEWDVAVEQSGAAISARPSAAQVLYRIYRELRSGAWFVEGSYD